jgi:hypothetical protein
MDAHELQRVTSSCKKEMGIIEGLPSLLPNIELLYTVISFMLLSKMVIRENVFTWLSNEMFVTV